MLRDLWHRIKGRALTQWRKRKDTQRRLKARLARTDKVCTSALNVLTFIGSIACLTLMLVYEGFDHGDGNARLIHGALHGIHILFIVTVVYNFVFNFRVTVRNSRWILWTVDILMMLTVVPLVMNYPYMTTYPALFRFWYSHTFLYAVMAAFSLVEICYGLMHVAGRRTNPSLLMAGSFLFFILLGSVVLMMPKCTYDGISYMDSLFVSTSGVCICGLTPVDIADTFTPFGQAVLMVMFEIGGLGIITFTSFFAVFFTGSQSVYTQLLVRDMVYSKTMNSLVSTLFYILTLTVTLQAIGAVAIYLTLPDAVAPTAADRLWLSVFHAVSGFCNVGFSNITDGMSNPLVMNGGQSFYMVMSVLVFAGALGFPVLINMRDKFVHVCQGVWRRITNRHREPAPIHVIDLSTKIALTTTLVVFAIGFVAFFVFEAGGALSGMTLGERVSQSVFNAVMPRSGGFVSVSPATFANVTLLLVLVQMWIGGASQSMAGGIKVNALGVIMLNLRAILRGTSGVGAFRRRVSVPSLRRANAVVALSIFTLLLFAILLLLVEPQLAARAVVFEAFSATFNVGSSMGVTPQLGVAAKSILCVAMFVGRVGLISLLTGIMARRQDPTQHYLQENVIIS